MILTVLKIVYKHVNPLVETLIAYSSVGTFTDDTRASVFEWR